MSLTVYLSEDEIPENEKKNIVKENDIFFDARTDLSDDDFIRNALKSIDDAEYVSKYTFTGRTKKLGALNKSFLSTGTKTLINIFTHTDKIFYTCECGTNAIGIILKSTKGNIILQRPVFVFRGTPECDLICHGKHYTNLYDFINDAKKGNL